VTGCAVEGVWEEEPYVLGDLPQARGWQSASTVSGGKAWIFGGIGSTYFSDVNVLDTGQCLDMFGVFLSCVGPDVVSVKESSRAVCVILLLLW